MTEYLLLELRKHPNYEIECCEMLNLEWKRSNAARLHSLRKTGSDFPVSLILLEVKDGQRKLIGYAKVCRVLTDDKGCWVESVIIKNEYRNRGFGRKLMEAVEGYVKRRDFATVYLMTDDKEQFYKKLGYSNSETVCSVEGAWDEQRLQSLKGLFRDNTVTINVLNTPSNLSGDNSPITCNNGSTPPPPPPPPMQLSSTNLTMKSTLDPNKNTIYLKKTLN